MSQLCRDVQGYTWARIPSADIVYLPSAAGLIPCPTAPTMIASTAIKAPESILGVDMEMTSGNLGRALL